MITFEQIIYIDFEGRSIGRISEVKPGYYDIWWGDEPTPIVFASIEDAKAEALKTFKDHL